MSDEVRIPDVAGVIVAWRTWDVVWCGEGDVVLMTRCTWPSDEPLHAECTLGAANGWNGSHDAPGDNCLCGVHGLVDPARLAGQIGAANPAKLRHGSAVAGQVALWGRVKRHEHGYRAEYGKPLSIVPLWDCDETPAIREVRERYGLPLVCCPEMAEELAQWNVEDDGWGVMRVTMTANITAFRGALQRAASAAQQMTYSYHQAGHADDVADVFASADSDVTSDKPKVKRKPAWTALNPNEPRNQRKGDPRGPR